jgi:hypothetical protein
MRLHLGSVRERLLHQNLGKRDPQRSTARRAASRKANQTSSQK